MIILAPGEAESRSCCISGSSASPRFGKNARPVNHWVVLTRECENSKSENVGCGRNPDGCARHPKSRNSNRRMVRPNPRRQTLAGQRVSRTRLESSQRVKPVNHGVAGIHVLEVWLPDATLFITKKQRMGIVYRCERSPTPVELLRGIDRVIACEPYQIWPSHCSALRGRLCATSAKGRGGPNVCNCLIDEGRPLGTGWQEQVPNHLRRLWSKAMVVSTEGKGLGRTRSGDWQEEDRKGTTDDMSKA